VWHGVLSELIFSLYESNRFQCFLHTFCIQVNLVLDDAIEYTPDPSDKSKVIKTELDSEILLNGNQIAILVPGGTGPPEDSLAAQSS
jgi:U6 snRNA-associated Sm-like protein LSm5